MSTVLKKPDPTAGRFEAVEVSCISIGWVTVATGLLAVPRPSILPGRHGHITVLGPCPVQRCTNLYNMSRSWDSGSDGSDGSDPPLWSSYPPSAAYTNEVSHHSLSQLRHPATEIASHHLHQSLEAWSLGASWPSVHESMTHISRPFLRFYDVRLFGNARDCPWDLSFFVCLRVSLGDLRSQRHGRVNLSFMPSDFQNLKCLSRDQHPTL